MAARVSSVRVQRIALPRFQVEYTAAIEALLAAKKLQRSRVLLLEYGMSFDVGGEVVLDLALSFEPLQIGLLFRILERSPGSTTFEWCARRTTDADLLELWIQAIELQAGAPARSPLTAAPDVEVSQLLATCRRALTRNPFTALRIRWTAGEQEIAAAADALSAELENAQTRGGLSPTMTKLVTKALEEVGKTRRLISTAEGRRRARSQYVPLDQIQCASEQALSPNDPARPRKDAAEASRVQAEPVEPGARPTS